MFRRARFSVKPNVRPSAAGRSNSGGGSVTRAAPEPGGQHDPSTITTTTTTTTTTTCSSEAVESSVLQPGAAAGDVQPGGDGGSSNPKDEKTSDGDGDCSKHAETPFQRRKRISTVPNLAKPRVTPASTQRAVSLASKYSTKQGPPTLGTSVLQKETSSSEKVNVENSPKSPALPEKKTPVPQVPQFSPFKKSASKEPTTCVTVQRSDETLQKNTSSPLKERPTQEKLIQDETAQSKSAPEKEKKKCLEREKIIKTQKLRKMLKEELKKEKEQRKYKSPITEKNMPEDRSKMIMRDFIYYLPENNPMKSSLVEEKRTEKTSTVTQAKEPEERIVADHEDENEEDEDSGAGEEDGPLLVPRVKVAEDGSIILDEESLTVEVLRTKGQCVVEENDPIFERGSTTTYSSFRKSYYTKPWSEKETDMFFLAISMVGTDFSMISQLFPHRARTEIKNKFKREEKANGWRIDKAFREKKPFDFELFTKLLEKVLENERRKKEKEAKCQHQKEKNSSEKKAHLSQKKRKAKVINGQPSNGQEDFQSAGISDTEMEVDAETAEKENEASPTVLEQTEGQTVSESVVTKKKRKRKKKDAEHETENLPEERATPEEMAEGERVRKKRKNTPSTEVSSINEDDDELEVPGGVTPDEALSLVEEDPQCCIVDEEAEQDCISSIRYGAPVDAEPSELDIFETNSEQHTEQPSVSPDTNRSVFKGTSAPQQSDAVLDKLDGNQNAAPLSLDEEVRETEIAVTKKPRGEGHLQGTASDLTRASEKGDLLSGDTSEFKISPKSVGSAEKSTVEDKVNDKIGPTSEETDKISTDVESKSQQIQNAHVEKTEVRSHRQKPKPNIVKASSRKEAPAQSNLDKPEPVDAVEKNNVQDDVPNTITVDTAEEDLRHLDMESLACKESTLQEDSKQTVLKPAPLTRGRIQRPKPNLGRIVRRQGGSAKNAAAEDGKTAETAGEAEKIVIQPECNSDKLLDENITEAITYEADMAHSEVLQNKVVPSAEKVDSTPRSPGKTPQEFESHTSLSSKSLETMADHAARDSSHQHDQKEFFAETEESLKNYCLSPKQNLGKAAEKEEPSEAGKDLLWNKHENETTEERLVNISRKCSESSKLDETAISEIVPLSYLLEESSADAPDVVAPKKLQLSPLNLSSSESAEQNKVLQSSAIQKNISFRALSKQNSQEESKESVVRPTPSLRSRFQRPKPNIGRAIGKKETPSFEVNETIEILNETEKSALQKPEPTRTSTVVAKPPEVSPVETLEKRPVDTEKVNREDTQVSSTSDNILDPCPREKNILQESKLCTIRPAQLVRGRFQRARPNLGRIKEKREELVSENINAPDKEEVKNAEMEIIKESDLHPPLKDEVTIQASLGNLEKKEELESVGVLLPVSLTDQEKLSSSENSQTCELLKHQEEACVTKDDVRGRVLNVPVSGISAPQEESQSKTIKPAQLTRGRLQRPEPNITRATKKKDISSEDVSKEGQNEKDTENETTLCDSKYGKTAPVMHVSGNVVEAASTSEPLRQKDSTDSIETVFLKRSRHSGKYDSLEGTSESESQIKTEILKPISVRGRATETLKGKHPRRTLKQRKNMCDSKTLSESENDHSEKGKPHQKIKPNVSRGRSLKSGLRKKTRKEYGNTKVSLVTLRASSQEDEGEDDDDDDDFEPDYEVECFSPEEVNKAPVFVPKGLRSPNPVPVQIEETMEEVEIYENVADEPCLTHELNVAAQPVIQGDKNLCPSQVVILQEEQKKETGINYGSTEAAMTLLAMRDPVFQLNIAIQEKTREYAQNKELNVADSLPDEYYGEHSIVHCNVPCFMPSKNETSETMNRAATEDQSTEPSGFEDRLQEETNVLPSGPSRYEPGSSLNRKCPTVSGLEECLQEPVRASSVSSTSKESKTSQPVRCRFPKPKPNLNRGLGLNQNTSQKFLGLISDVEQLNQIQNEQSENTTEEQKIGLEQNFRLEELAQRNSAEKHDLQPGSDGPAMHKNNMEKKNLVKETWEVTAELTSSKLSPEAETSTTKLPCVFNANINVQVSRPVEPQLSPVEVAQVGTSKYSSISTTTNMTAVSGSVQEQPPTEEEPTFILTLVEIPNNSEDCSGIPSSLPQASEELLPAPVFCTSGGSDAVEPEREDRPGTVTTAIEEDAVLIDNNPEKPRLEIASSEQLEDLVSSSLKHWKRCAVALEESDSSSGKKQSPSPTVEELERSNKEPSPELRCISKKAAEKNSEKWNISKTKISSTSRYVPELQEGQKEQEQPQSSLNVWSMLSDEAASTDKQASRTFRAGKSERSEKQRNFIDTCKSLQSEQVGSTAVLPKTSLSRSYQRSLGFLPLICTNNNVDEEEITKGKKEPFHKTDEVISERAADCPISPKNKKEEIQENRPFQTTVLSPLKSEGGSSSAVQVFPELSDNEGSSKEQEKEEEPTRISEYFFSDIFMEVDDPE